MTTSASLRRQVLARIKPSPALTRLARAAARALSSQILAEARRRRIHIKTELVGSLAKNTHLSEPLDIDLFLLFPATTLREDLETKGLELAGKFLTAVERRYAEHPYVHGRFEGLAFDVVPAFAIKNPKGRRSAVDRTPFHTRYVRRKLPPRGRDEVRLLKGFLRGIGAYGAETAVGGASGYLVELLILKFRTFDRTLAAMAGWDDRVDLALEKNPPPLGGTFVFSDPVDPERNAAAAVVPRQFIRLKRAAKAYRKKPSLRFFFPNPPRLPAPSRLENLLAAAGLAGLEVPPPRVAPQAQVPHLQRLGLRVSHRLAEEGFSIRRDAVERLDEGFALLWETSPKELPASRIHRGPEVRDEANAKRFLGRWKKDPLASAAPYEERGRWWVETKVLKRSPVDVVRAALPSLLGSVQWTDEDRAKARVLDKADWLSRDGLRWIAWRHLRRLEPWQW